MTDAVLVVPCFNEAARLDTDRFTRLIAEVEGIDILFVNDGSSDSTADVLAELCRRHPTRLRWLDLPSNCGKGEAVRRGVIAAAAERPRYVGYWDADLATPLEAVVQFREVLDRNPAVHAVLGSRMRLLGRTVSRRRSRRWLGNLFGLVASWVLGIPLRDPQCGAKLFRQDPGLSGLFDRPFRSRWIFDVEILARLLSGAQDRIATARRLIYEQPLDEWSEVAGSKLRSRDFVWAAWDLARIAVEYRLSRDGRRRVVPAPAFAIDEPAPAEVAAADQGCVLPLPSVKPTKAA